MQTYFADTILNPYIPNLILSNIIRYDDMEVIVDTATRWGRGSTRLLIVEHV